MATDTQQPQTSPEPASVRAPGTPPADEAAVRAEVEKEAGL